MWWRTKAQPGLTCGRVAWIEVVAVVVGVAGTFAVVGACGTFVVVAVAAGDGVVVGDAVIVAAVVADRVTHCSGSDA